MVRSKMESRRAEPAGEFLVEVIGPDGLKHHVGPFKLREDAEAWIAQNPTDSEPRAVSRGENLSLVNGRRKSTSE